MVSKKAALKNAVLTIFSLIFYAWGGAEFIFLLILSTFSDYVIALLIMRSSGGRKRLYVASSIAINLGLLCYFKYANFLILLLDSFISGVGISQVAASSIALPIGISFFTFHRLSYIIDVYRGTRRAFINVLDFFLYVTMFPQLIAGPIVRFHEISDQIKSRTESIHLLYEGVLYFCWGLIKKTVFANSCGEIADAIFNLSPDALDTKTAWLGVSAYTIQIYFDFSAYSDMAIGLAMIFGFRLPENFNRPYSAISLTDFWRRWHMTLTRWFRDYLYIPLGGNKKGALRTYLNLMIVFILCGLWHGAYLPFLIWGLYHGGFLIIERFTGLRNLSTERYILSRRVITLLIVMVGWVIFRSNSFSQLSSFISAMFLPKNLPLPFHLIPIINSRNIFFFLLASIVFILPTNLSVTRYLLQNDKPLVILARLALITVGVPYSIALIASGSYNPFIYFRF
ncbi:MAG TPA: MBOAT family protein [Nitrospirota bacterium]|nr:MBOAT family protein [Nitrospirota bacterium]